jgi:hypothetical protein
VPPRALIEPERLQPGDVLVVRDRSLIGRLLRRGAGFSDSVNGWNHVVVASHRDASGTFWGVEAKPSRVGEVVIDYRVADRWSLANWDQPKTVASATGSSRSAGACSTPRTTGRASSGTR